MRVSTALAAGLLALSMNASAQTNQEVKHTHPSTPSTSAIASADEGVGYGQMTKDGREFGKLTEKEVDGLERGEKKVYYAWKNAQLDATVIGVKEERKDTQTTLILEKRGLE